MGDSGRVCDFTDIQVDVLGEPEDDSSHVSPVANRVDGCVASNKRDDFFDPIAVFVAKVRMFLVNAGIQDGDLDSFVAPSAKNTVLSDQSLKVREPPVRVPPSSWNSWPAR